MIKKKILALFLVATMLMSVIAISINAATPTATTTGMTFDNSKDNIWKTNTLFDVAPHTFETWIKVAKGETGSGSGRVGNIFNNFIGSGNSTICFDIQTNGNPRLYWGYNTSSQANIKFSNVDVRTGEWLHLAIVLDAKNLKLHCYINGELKQTQNAPADYADRDLGTIFSLGGDNRPYDHQYYFHGNIASLSAYGDALSATDIASIYANGPLLTNDSIVCAYDVSTAPTGDQINDISGNNNHLYITDPTINTPAEKEDPEDPEDPENPEDPEEAKDYAYSFAVVGDTQYLVKNDVNKGTNNTATLYDWIIANKESKKIQAVFGMGDITDGYSDTAQWDHAKENIIKLDGKLPYYLVRGNHDTSDTFNTYFNNDTYKSQFADPDIKDQSKCFFSSKQINNAYTKFTVGDTKYLLMMLDYGAKDDALAWANEVIAANPTYRVIITTHSYLAADGSWIDDETYSPDPTGDKIFNNGVEMWEKLMSKHRNIFLVLCGHDNKVPNGNILMLQSKGDGGNTVTQMMINPQRIEQDENGQQYGMVAMLYFNEDGSKVEVEYISTVLSDENGDYLYREENQFEFTLISNEGNGIANIEFVKREGLVDTYRIYYTNGTYQEYTITNGADGEDGKDGTDGGSGSVPTIEISADGYWVIGGVKTEYKAIGSDGKDGVDGEDGKDGTDGKDGITPTIEISADGYWVINGIKTEYKAIGSDGKDGINGSNGKDGVDGEDGKDGINGTDGKDGIDGADGKDGKDGKDGVDGKDGKDGVTPTIEISADGYWVINGIKTEYKAIGTDGKDGKDGKDGINGINGKDGKDGIDGKDGKDGVTPTIEIDKDGYWVINGVKTEYKAAATIDADSNIVTDSNGDMLPIICTAICLASCIGTIIFCTVYTKKKSR